MAKAGAKQRLEENRRKITFLTWLIIASAVAFAAIRLGIFRSTSSGMLVAAYFITLLMSLGSFGALRSASAPVFAASGELIDGGADLKKSGVTETMLDWIYLTAAVHILGSFLDIAWYLYWLAPIYIGVVLWTKVIKRIRDASAAEPVEMDDETRKKLEKKQAKAERKRTRGMRAF